LQDLSKIKEVYENFDLVTNRESISIGLMEKEGFNVSKSLNQQRVEK
jgi:hypothetical protein